LTGDGQLEDGSEIDSGKLVVTEPQVLVSKLNPRKGTVCIARPQEVLTVCSSEFVPLLPRRVAIQFVWYMVQSENYRTRLESLVESATKSHQRAAPSDICRVKWAFPPSGEQELISSFLEHETAKIDALIAEQQRLIELLQEKRQAVISHAGTKGLNPNAPMKDSGIEWLGEVPEHWEVRAMKRLFQLVMEPSPPNNDFELLSLYTEIGVRPRKSLEAKGNKATTTDGYWLVKKGDLIVNKLLAWMGAFGISEYEGVTSPAYDILRNKAPLNTYFYDHLLRCGILFTEIRRFSRGIMDMRLRLYFEELGQFKVPYPPLPEQDAIVGFLRQMFDRFDALAAEAARAIALLQERRSALISAAVTGQIDVRGFPTGGGSEAA